MDALVMAGGRGSRLNLEEKPLAELLGRPLIDYVVSALQDCSAERIIIAITDIVPATRKWAEERDLTIAHTSGKGFVADMAEAVEISEVSDPILVTMADLPLLTSDLLDDIMEFYQNRPEPALSTHTPLDLHRRLGRRPDSLFNYGGQLIVPSGINILDGANIREEQEDYHLIMERIELAVNVNVSEDLKLCESILLGDLI